MNYDKILLKILITNKNKININKFRKITFYQLYPNIKEYLLNRFVDSDSLQETINRIKYHIEIRPVCKVCGNRVKYINCKEKLFREWLNEAECSTINEFKRCVSTLREWHEYISNYFKYNYSNGPTEGKNNLIKVIKRISFGFRNFNNFRNRILILNLK